MDVESYKDRFIGYMNGAAVCQAVEIAKDPGILQLFIDPHQPMTVEEIATKSNSKPRYVKELLGCLVTGKIIDIDEAEKYFVADEIRPVLRSMSISSGLLDFCFRIKDDSMAVLSATGPTGYLAQSKPGFGKNLTARRNFDLPSLIEGELFSSTPELKDRIESGINFVEYGSGEGAVILELARRFPQSQFTAVDYSQDAIDILKCSIQERSLINIRAVHADVFNLPSDWSDMYDVAYMRDTLHDLGDPIKSLQEILKTLKSGGYLSITEVNIKGDNLREQRDCRLAPQYYFYSFCICVPESLHQAGGMALGCTSQKVFKSILVKAGIPEKAIETYPVLHSESNFRMVYKKNVFEGFKINIKKKIVLLTLFT